jgi:hypothetical protein
LRSLIRPLVIEHFTEAKKGVLLKGRLRVVGKERLIEVAGTRIVSLLIGTLRLIEEGFDRLVLRASLRSA